eukprot:TRINITY_DN111678_c0_g1_i1.p1 TRINITY_DN111678_c0_g1~~TRINITY_DN111678_c0_g1_i1.p1  ORF type:complete len:103 (+),score=4.87 TRINITY_DN111678_c0_g1_i1:128-436(+)
MVHKVIFKLYKKYIKKIRRGMDRAVGSIGHNRTKVVPWAVLGQHLADIGTAWPGPAGATNQCVVPFYTPRVEAKGRERSNRVNDGEKSYKGRSLDGEKKSPR